MKRASSERKRGARGPRLPLVRCTDDEYRQCGTCGCWQVDDSDGSCCVCRFPFVGPRFTLAELIAGVDGEERAY